MCGIAGMISSTHQSPEIIRQMTNALHHRGPDAQAIFTDETGRISLGHTRLSIIDLSNAANQPFHSADGRYVIVFNGEIYNFQTLRQELERKHQCQFKTHSDTEVIVEGFSVWREALVDKLEGMFAFVIADLRENKLFLFRDRAGKKPLYYYKSDSLFAFASELKSLLRHPEIASGQSIRHKVVSTFLHLGYIPGPHTIYQNIFKFPAGHWGTVNSALEFATKAYWKISHYTDRVPYTPASNVKDELRARLMQAVKDRLISDVPLGAFLSGGTDSSLIVALAQQQMSKPLKTFSIGFEESTFDESVYAKQVSEKLGTQHTAYTLSQREAMSLLETYLAHFDEPFADTSAIPTMLVSRLARQEVTVALTGDGGDELFQGYGAYTWANRLDNPFVKFFKQPIKAALQISGKSRLQRIAGLFEHYTGSLQSHIFSQEQYFFSQREIRDRVLVDNHTFELFEYDNSYLSDTRLTAGEKQALFDFEYYLKDDLLVKVDRASMYYALECRSPLLDHRVAEFATSLGQTWKIRGGKSKWILKELLREHLPNALVDRKKWGFSIPLAGWLKNDLHYLVEDNLNKQALEKTGLFDVRYVEKLIAEFRTGKTYLYNRVWVLIVLQRWLLQHSSFTR